jgi:hypothetical protein
MNPRVSLSPETATLHLGDPQGQMNSVLYLTRSGFSRLLDVLARALGNSPDDAPAGAQIAAGVTVYAYAESLQGVKSLSLTFHSGGTLGLYSRVSLPRKVFADLVEEWAILDADTYDNDAHRAVEVAP